MTAYRDQEKIPARKQRNPSDSLHGSNLSFLRKQRRMKKPDPTEDLPDRTIATAIDHTKTAAPEEVAVVKIAATTNDVPEIQIPEAEALLRAKNLNLL